MWDRRESRSFSIMGVAMARVVLHHGGVLEYDACT